MDVKRSAPVRACSCFSEVRAVHAAGLHISYDDRPRALSSPLSLPWRASVIPPAPPHPPQERCHSWRNRPAVTLSALRLGPRYRRTSNEITPPGPGPLERGRRYHRSQTPPLSPLHPSVMAEHTGERERGGPPTLTDTLINPR